MWSFDVIDLLPPGFPGTAQCPVTQTTDHENESFWLALSLNLLILWLHALCQTNSKVIKQENLLVLIFQRSFNQCQKLNEYFYVTWQLKSEPRFCHIIFRQILVKIWICPIFLNFPRFYAQASKSLEDQLTPAKRLTTKSTDT